MVGGYMIKTAETKVVVKFLRKNIFSTNAVPTAIISSFDALLKKYFVQPPLIITRLVVR